MNLPGEPLKGQEPPDGDFARYIEQLNSKAPSDGRVTSRSAGSGSSGISVVASTEPPVATAAPGQAESSAPDVLPSRFAETIRGVSPRKAAPWMIAAGIGLLLASLSDDPLIASPVPGIALIGAGLAIGRHFKGR